MNEIPVPCRDCINEPTCDAECTGHLTDAEWEALSKFLVWKYGQKEEPKETDVSNIQISY